MAYTTWLIIIATIGIMLAFLVPLLRKSRISNLQNIDYITQFTMYMSAFVLLFTRRPERNHIHGHTDYPA
jgi:hypothetical protein